MSQGRAEVVIDGFGDHLACGCAYTYQRSPSGVTSETVLRCPEHAGRPRDLLKP